MLLTTYLIVLVYRSVILFYTYLKITLNRLKRKIYLENKYSDFQIFVFRMKVNSTVLNLFTFMPVSGKFNILILKDYVTRIFGMLHYMLFLHVYYMLLQYIWYVTLYTTFRFLRNITFFLSL